MRIRQVLPVVGMVGVLLAGCTGDPEPTPDPVSTPSSTAGESTPSESPSDSSPSGEPSAEEPSGGQTSPTGTPDAESPGGFDTAAKQSADFPDLPAVELLPTQVRVAHHDGFDRVVVEFTGDGEPGYRAEYVDEAVEPGSGEPIEIEGDHVLQVTITGTRIPNADEKYAEKDDYPLNDATVVKTANFFPPFEGQSQLVLGVDGEAPFRVQVLSSPARLVIDVATG